MLIVLESKGKCGKFEEEGGKSGVVKGDNWDVEAWFENVIYRLSHFRSLALRSM